MGTWFCWTDPVAHGAGSCRVLYVAIADDVAIAISNFFVAAATADVARQVDTCAV